MEDKHRYFTYKLFLYQASYKNLIEPHLGITSDCKDEHNIQGNTISSRPILYGIRYVLELSEGKNLIYLFIW